MIKFAPIQDIKPDKTLMKKGQLICLSFVGVLKQPLTIIPNIESNFCRNLFGMPYETFNGITPEGYVIAISNKPFPMVILSPTRIIIKAENKDSLIQYTQAIKEELKKMNTPISLASFGINNEYQWLGLEVNADEWLWNHFIGNNINTNNEYHMCNNINLRIGINENQFANIELAPRIGTRNGLFANINHHHNITLDEIPNTRLLSEYIDASNKIINSCIISKLIGN